MGSSRLTTFSMALRIIVGVLRLPLSFAVFWKYPHLAMLMDHMVTHLRVYSMLGEPYMAYVEVIFQTVANSKVLPFNFANPFEQWNPSTLDCRGFPGLRSKNLQCSWFDNYGQNVIGLLSVAVLCYILYRIGHYMAARSQQAGWQTTLYRNLQRDYGLKFMMAKLDANHLEIFLMTLIAYCTADNTSKSVTGIIISTSALVAFALLGVFLTLEAKRIYESSPSSSVKAESQYNTVKSQVVADVDKTPQTATVTQSPSSHNVSTPVRGILEFMFEKSSKAETSYSAYFHLSRYLRALLMAIIVTVDRNPTEQVVLLIILESAYFAVLLLLDHRGDKIERLFYAGMHLLMLIHLIFRAVATSKSLSVSAVHSGMSNLVAVVLVVYIFFHILTALLTLAGLCFKSKTAEAKVPEQPVSNQIEYSQKSPKIQLEVDDMIPEENPEQDGGLRPAGNPSQMNMNIPEEFGEGFEVPEEFS